MLIPFLLDQDGNNIKLPGAIVTAWAAPVEVTIKSNWKTLLINFHYLFGSRLKNKEGHGRNSDTVLQPGY